MNDKSVGGVHWSFWAISAAALIWNVLGCVNFFSQMNAEAVAGMPESYRAIVESRPAWATGAFAIAVFGGAQIPFLGMADFPIEALIGGLMQVVVTAFLIWYPKWADSKGWIN